MGRDVEMTDYDAALQTLSIERSSVQRRLVGLNRWIVRGFQGSKVGRSCSSTTARFLAPVTQTPDVPLLASAFAYLLDETHVGGKYGKSVL